MRWVEHQRNSRPMHTRVCGPVGQLIARRMSRLWKVFFGGMAGPETAAPNPIAWKLFDPSRRYPAAAGFAELKQLGAPATLDVSPPSFEVEDHATSAPLAVRTSQVAVGLLEDILAVELLLAHDVLSAMPTRPGLGSGTSAALRGVEAALAGTVGQSPATVYAAVRATFAQTKARPQRRRSDNGRQ